MKNLKNLFYIVLSLFVLSCTNNDDFGNNHDLSRVGRQEIGGSNAEIPYAGIEQLKSLQEDDSFVDYELSRKAALLEMTNFWHEFNAIGTPGELKLSDRPVIVSDVNGVPKLYEFIVYDSDNKAIATITAFARKEVIDFTACVLPFIRDYSSKNALFYTSFYPYVDDKEVEGTFLRAASNREFEELPEIDSEKDITSFWQSVELKKEEITNLDDMVFINKYLPSKTRRTDYYTIPTFNRDNLKRTRFTGACGPAAMAWVYRGFYTSFNGKYIPLHGEPNNVYYSKNTNGSLGVSWYTSSCEIFQVMDEACGASGGLIDGATMPGNFDWAVGQLFPNHYIQRIQGVPKGAPRRAIQSGDPVYMVVFAPSGQLHYIIGFGTKDKYGFLGIHTNSWILVQDNGTNTGSHGYMPYYRNSAFTNISNKYTHLGVFRRI